jgi:nitroreductase
VSDYPSLIFVYSLVDDSEEMTEENYGAVCCAIQNMQLVATSIGLSAGWSTGKVSKLQNMDRVFGITEKLKMVGVLTIGEPEDSVDKSRTSYEELTQWF